MKLSSLLEWSWWKCDYHYFCLIHISVVADAVMIFHLKGISLCRKYENVDDDDDDDVDNEDDDVARSSSKQRQQNQQPSRFSYTVKVWKRARTVLSPLSFCMRACAFRIPTYRDTLSFKRGGKAGVSATTFSAPYYITIRNNCCCEPHPCAIRRWSRVKINSFTFPFKIYKIVHICQCEN